MYKSSALPILLATLDISAARLPFSSMNKPAGLSAGSLFLYDNNCVRIERRKTVFPEPMEPKT
ncbi:MAG: hypothetical protein ABIH39_04525 [Candidatus Margulisiibacteriota bacterium]